MKAVVLRSFGGSEQLLLENVPDPAPAFGEIVLEVASVLINRSFDLSVRKGAFPTPFRDKICDAVRRVMAWT